MGLCVVGFADAARASCHVAVHGWTGRPGAIAVNESFIEAWNNGTEYCRIQVDRDHTNPESYLDCPTCVQIESSYCPGIALSNGGSGFQCATSASSTVVIPPRNGAAAGCAYTVDCMPKGPDGGSCCDTQGPCNGNIANTPAEFCSSYSTMLVRLTGHKTTAGGAFEEVDQVICASGDPYMLLYPEAPSCFIESYCDLAYGERVFQSPCH